MCAQASTACSSRQTDARQCRDALDSDDDDHIRNRMRQYERKIELLLQQVAELEAEVSVIHEIIIIKKLF